MAAGDPYYEDLVGAAAMPQKGKGMLGGIGKGGALKVGGSIAAWMLLSKLLNTYNQGAEQKVAREAIGAQERMASPENLFYEASLPQAQQEEQMAKAALMSHLMGGVIGPSLAPGERRIGGR